MEKNSFLLFYFLLLISSAFSKDTIQIFIEAEDFTGVDTTGWEIREDLEKTYGGKYLFAKGGFESRYKVFYEIALPANDTYFVFLRTWATNSSDNGVFILLDNKNPVNDKTSGIYFYKKERWYWNAKILCGESCHEETPFFIIEKPRKHLFALSLKEKSVRIDKICITNIDQIPQDPHDMTMDKATSLFDIDKKKFDLKQILFSILAIALAIFLALYKTRKQKKEIIIKHSKHKEEIDRAKNFIEENFTKNISIADIAREAGLSESYMGRVFKNETNQSILNYINDLRIDKSIELMKTTPKNVTQIHNEVGFSDSSYFSKVFKKRVGLSPSKEILKYRR